MGSTLKLLTTGFLLAFVTLSSPAQIMISTVAGGGSEDGLPAIQAHQSPNDHMIFGPDGTIYFTSHYRIWSITPDGILHLLAGTGYTNDNGDGPALSRNLHPGGLARDTQGNLYFSDWYRVRKLSGGTVTTIAGNGLPPSYTTDGDPLSVPVDLASTLAVDASGNIYVGEPFESRVRKITPDGKISLYAGAQQPFLTQYASFLPDDGDNGPATLAHIGELNDIALDAAGNLYIGESNSIRRVIPGGAITTIATGQSMSSLAVSPSGSVYVYAGNQSTAGIYQVQAGGGIAQVVNLASFGVSTIGVDASSNLYYTSGALLKVSGGSAQAIAGRGTYSSPDGAQAASAIIYPLAMATDDSGRIIFFDHSCRLRRINSDGTLATLAGTGICGSSATAGPALMTSLPYASQIAAGGGNVFISTGNRAFEWLDANGNIQTLANTAAYGLAADSTGTAWLGVGNGIEKFTPGSAPVAITGPVIGVIGINGGVGSANAITTDSSGNVYVVFGGSSGNQQGWELSGGAWKNKFGTPPEFVNSLCLNGAATYFGVGTSLFQFTASSASLVGMLQGNSGDGGPAQAAQFSGINGVACDANGNVYVLDSASARIRKLSGSLPAAAPVISANGVVSSASYAGGAIAAQELISIFGQNLAPATQVASVVDNYIGPVVGNVKVTIAGNPVPVLAVSPGQINAVVPRYEANCPSPTIAIQVWVDGIPSAVYNAPCAPAAPALYSADQTGKGPGAILNQDASINSAANPAARGSVITLYGTGAGAMDTVLYDGYLDLSAPYGNIAGSVTVSIGNENAAVQYAGGAPDLIDGAFQINATVPADLAPGLTNVSVTVGGVASNTVQVWLR